MVNLVPKLTLPVRGDTVLFDGRAALIASTILVAAGTLSYTLWKRHPFSAVSSNESNDAAATDPGLLKKFSSKKTYHVPATGFTYTLRVFYREHSQADKLPSKPTPLPLIVFVHGLGGSIAQFNPLMTSLVNVGPCLALDLPGCGLSDFKAQPRAWGAYTHESLAELISVVISDHLSSYQGIVFVAHSMGCSLAATLCSTKSSIRGSLANKTLGLVAICPKGTPPTEHQQKLMSRLLSIPTPIFDLMRFFDRQGGINSASVKRLVGDGADEETRRLQYRYNHQSQTPVWRRMAHGFMIERAEDPGKTTLPSLDLWTGINVPTFLVAGEADTLTPPEEVEKIGQVLRESWGSLLAPQKDEGSISTTEHSETHNDHVANGAKQHVQNKALKIAVLPRPASHALMFSPDSCRILSGLIQGFIAKHVDQRLGLGWQLKHLSTEGKWDVKNLTKWQKIQPVSDPIGGVFRAMKTMREVDDLHTPKIFAEQWKDDIWIVCDISHEAPVYDPRSLQECGIEYVKFPTVSKLPPSEDEVSAFNSMIDSLRARRHKETPGSSALIAVHCHYGFNRTGFFLVCYLVEREGWKLQDALDEFSFWRPPGIKHAYFIDALYARYCAAQRPQMQKHERRNVFSEPPGLNPAISEASDMGETKGIDAGPSETGLRFQRLDTPSPGRNAARLGALRYGPGKTLYTPNFISPTSRGVVSHITPDVMMDETNIEGVYVALEDFVEKTLQPTPSVLQYPVEEGQSRLRHFIGLPDEQLLVLGARRAPPLACPMPNTNDSVALSTSVGFQMLPTSEFARSASNLSPDIVIALGDVPVGAKPGHRKLDKMVTRTEKWVKEMIDAFQQPKDRRKVSIFAPVLPVEIQQQSWYIDLLATELRLSLSGLAVYDSSVLPDLSQALEDLPRLLMSEPSSPHQILRDIGLGADVCTLPLVGSASDAGLALTFKLRAAADQTERRPLALNMWDASHSTDLSPITSGCQCYGCRMHHRAYLQHLLSAKEMLAWVLLQVHNFTVMDEFFEDIRASIAAGTFDEDAMAFNTTYEPELPKSTGQGPRVRGYQFRNEGPGETKKNAPAYRSLSDRSEKHAQPSAANVYTSLKASEELEMAEKF